MFSHCMLASQFDIFGKKVIFMKYCGALLTMNVNFEGILLLFVIHNAFMPKKLQQQL